MRQAKQGFGGSLMMIAGIGAGAALMYLLDPQRGADRRRQIASSAAGVASGAGDAASKAWHEVSHHAGAVGQKLSQQASHLAGAVRETADEVSAGIGSGSATAHEGAHRLRDHIADHARDLQSTVSDYAARLAKLASRARRYVSSAKNSAGGYAEDLRDRAGDLRHRAHDYFHPRRSSSIVGITVTAASIVGIGAGAIYLLDSEKGPQRREMIYDKISGAVCQTGRAFRTTGEYLRSQWDKIVGEITYENPNSEPHYADRSLAPLHESSHMENPVEPSIADELSNPGRM